MPPDDVDPLRQESNELVAILTTMVKKTRRRRIGVSLLILILTSGLLLASFFD